MSRADAPGAKVRRFPSPPGSAHALILDPDDEPSYRSPPDLPAFDLIRELQEDPDRFHGEDWLSIHGFPTFLRTCIDRVRSKVEKPRGVSFSLATACCLTRGYQVLVQDLDIADILALKQALHHRDDLPADEFEELAAWFRSFALSVPDMSGAGNSRVNVQVLGDLRGSINTLAQDLGVPCSALAVMCVVAALNGQASVLVERQEDLDVALRRFYRRVRVRLRVAESWLSALRDKDWSQSK